MDITKDCHLSYKHVGGKATIHNLGYVQPWCALKVVPPSKLPSEDWQAIRYAHHTTKQGPILVPPLTQEPVSQIEVPPVSVTPPVATSPPTTVPVLSKDLSKI